jgi:ectoine hydroxylase-related dioxygenase (phytanoyl-CoA dioxygenase family)
MLFHRTDLGSEVHERGYAIVENVFSKQELDPIISLLEKASRDREALQGGRELFAIRSVLSEIPALREHLKSERFYGVRIDLSYMLLHCIKSIYFNKLPAANWFVPWHQDLTINVKERIEAEGFGQWTFKHGIHSVVPPVNILENIFTLRLHLDDTDETNGALQVIPGSHAAGILSAKNISRIVANETPVTCNVKAGSVMVMKPLLLHSSSRSISGKPRRVLHLEYIKQNIDPVEVLEYHF